MIQSASLRTTTDGGRTLSGRSFGPADGTPILFIAGAATGKSMSFGDEFLDAFNIRLLTMDRPGMGDSIGYEDRTLNSTSNDYRVFVEQALGLRGASIPVIANSQGGVFGLSAALHGWVSRLVLASPADEVSNPTIHAMLPHEATQLADIACSDPEQAANMLASFTAQDMETMVINGSHPSDKAFYQQPVFLSLYRKALEEGFAQDGKGYVADTMIAMRPWNLKLTDIHVPTTILYGAHDQSHSPDKTATLASRIPTAKRVVIDNAGGALLWTHSKQVLRAALEN
ncbi:MAG: alpha/beta fold hydrolase [Bifidobacterium crudilactis]|uniref:alpha/beta fold hydrolase n=1 Tax=Bifidobacterium crudilactis TaxID=327277 RepID=UPI003F9E5E25